MSNTRSRWRADIGPMELISVALFFVGGTILSVGFAIVYVGMRLVGAWQGMWFR